MQSTTETGETFFHRNWRLTGKQRNGGNYLHSPIPFATAHENSGIY